MKKLIVLAAVLMLCLSGCGGSDAPEATPTPAPTPTPEVTATPAPAASALEIAQGYVEQEVAGLIEEIGEPLASEYVSSCMGPGQDGELNYDGFTVYTYKEGSSEIVKVVFAE